MARLVKIDSDEEGLFFCKWLHNRLMRNNKNVLGAELGPTGSGKSYRDLRKVELWYKYEFDKPFPKENICFGVGDIMKRITSGELKRGDILIFEEAGANLGSLDFQNKIAKMFTYVLQSFRSMNIGIFFNLPYLSMLNKQARMLMHYSSESLGIDFKNNKNSCKFFFHQVNQSTGKVYKKYPRARHHGRVRTLKKVSYSMPSSDLVSAYEKKKAKYLLDMTSEYVKEIEEKEWEKQAKMERKELTVKEQDLIKMLEEGDSMNEIAKRLGVNQSVISRRYKNIKKKGYDVQKGVKSLENDEN